MNFDTNAPGTMMEDQQKETEAHAYYLSDMFL